MDSIGSFYVENGIDPYDPDELDNWVSYSQDPLGELIRSCYRGTKRRRKSQSYSSVRNTKPVLAMLTCKFGADCRNLKEKSSCKYYHFGAPGHEERKRSALRHIGANPDCICGPYYCGSFPCEVVREENKAIANSAKNGEFNAEFDRIARDQYHREIAEAEAETDEKDLEFQVAMYDV